MFRETKALEGRQQMIYLVLLVIGAIVTNGSFIFLMGAGHSIWLYICFGALMGILGAELIPPFVLKRFPNDKTDI